MRHANTEVSLDRLLVVKINNRDRSEKSPFTIESFLSIYNTTTVIRVERTRILHVPTRPGLLSPELVIIAHLLGLTHPSLVNYPKLLSKLQFMV